MRTRFRSDEGFNLLELMAVLMILGIVLLIAVGSYVLAVDRAAALACAQHRRQLAEGAELFVSEFDRQPTTMVDLAPYVKNFDMARVCPRHDSTDLVYDADTRTVSCPTHSN